MAASIALTPKIAAADPSAHGIVAPALDARIVGIAEARAALAAWRQLFHACVEANPFYGPDFLLPLLDLDPRPVRFILVSEGAELVGLAPILHRRFALPGLWRVLATFGHPFIFNGLPLLRRGFEARAWHAILDALAARHRGGVLAIAASPLDGPAARGLTEALAQSGRASLVRTHPERAGIVAAGSLDTQLARIKSKTMGKLRRHERDLAKLGALEFRVAGAGRELTEAVEAFMALEARGWKGRQGTAFASDPRSAAFARRALAATEGAPGVRVETLMLDQRPIGACLHLLGPGYAVTFKIAYEEELARHAPGVLAMLGSLRTLSGEHWTQRLDSGVGAEDAVGAIWHDRIAAGEMLVALAQRHGQAQLRLYAKAVAWTQQARQRARDAYYALTHRKRTQARKAKR
ncbi:Acetyltransferase involved in cellulose biosynthesis, CelD/BcsL family [Rhizobiales bacterium GAS191]|nr:Acetyltransferase involved in cellulose biosynthesis, CelD/BcsL family [Rhizobiales bacterium GAS191]